VISNHANIGPHHVLGSTGKSSIISIIELIINVWKWKIMGEVVKYFERVKIQNDSSEFYSILLYGNGHDMMYGPIKE
jgi:hypothetical protein